MRTLATGFYGSVAMGDPMSAFTDRTFMVAYDFTKKAVPANKVVPLIAVPKGLVIDRISVVQTKADADASKIKFALASDEEGFIGTEFQLGDEENLLRDSQSASAFTGAADILCLVTTTAVKDGKIEVCLHGMDVFAEGDAARYSEVPDIETYRASLQSESDLDMNRSDPTGGQWPLD